MQTIQIDGTYTYADNIKHLKIGDKIKLVPNPFNKSNKEAIGAYTQCGKKIGYIPFKSHQIDLKAIYTVCKIQLTQSNPLLLVSMDWPNTNSIQCEPSCITNKKLFRAKFTDIPDSLIPDFKKFTKFLQNSGYDIEKIGICELSDSNITICIQTPTRTNFFHTVTKSFYETNIFKYDEFYKFGLIPKCIYIPWQTHRLEKYLEFAYKPTAKLFSGKAYSWDNLVKSGVFEGLDLPSMSGLDCGIPSIQTMELAVLEKKSIPKSIGKSDVENWVKLLVQYNISLIDYYNPDNFEPESFCKLDLDYLKSMFANLEPGGLAYNHKLKAYCPIDLADPINLVEITLDNTISKKKFIE